MVAERFLEIAVGAVDRIEMKMVHGSPRKDAGFGAASSWLDYTIFPDGFIVDDEKKLKKRIFAFTRRLASARKPCYD